MKQINLSTAFIALFRQNLTRQQIANELHVSVEELDEIMGIFIIYDDSLPFLFREKFELLITPIKKLELSTKIQHSFENQNIIYFWQAVNISKEELLSLHGFGKSSLAELDTYILKHLLDRKINNPCFFTSYPGGISFSHRQILVLKENTLLQD